MTKHLDNSATEQTAMIKDLKIGTYFKRKIESKKVYIRGPFAGHQYYECGYADDANDSIDLKGDTVVFIGFTY